MAEKETLLKLFQTAKKAADMAACMTLRNGPEVSRCLEAFDKLRSYAITKDLLLSTMVRTSISVISLLIFFVFLFYLLFLTFLFFI